MKHDTLLHPEVVNYFTEQKDPLKYVNNLVDNIHNLPMILTLEDVQNFEKSNVVIVREDKGEVSPAQSPEPNTTLVNPPAPKMEKMQVKTDSTVITPGERKKMFDSKTPMPQLQTDESLSGGIMRAGDGAVGMVHDITKSSRPELTAEKSKEYPEFKIISDITGKSTCEGVIKDFNRNILHRFNTLKNIIKTQYRIFARSVDIEKIKLNYKREVFFIGMITSVNKTAKGNTIISVEDETGEVSVFLNQETFKSDKKFLLDEVIGVIGETNMELKMVMAERIVRPAPPRSRTIHRAEEDIDVLFISDIHVGSKEFLEMQWSKLMKWLNGKEKVRGDITADKISYIVVAGDLVDGIGIYPDQENELIIKDIYKQYSRLAELLDKVPEDIK
ncbi:MAG: metallophosphoesterase, partial [Thermoplasmata archaeon]